MVVTSKTPAPAPARDRWRALREAMVRELRERRGIQDRRVLAALATVERHRFVAPALRERAYGPYALPIGGGQSMPHPYLVAVMAEALRLQGNERVLEIGTGSGYQTAILAWLSGYVWSLERLPELAVSARERLEDLGVTNVSVVRRAALELPQQEPAAFDAIHVSAAVPEVPGLLLAQLAPGGRMVLPVGRGAHQRLLLLVRQRRSVRTYHLGACRFAPLRGQRHPVGGRETAAAADGGQPPGDLV